MKKLIITAALAIASMSLFAFKEEIVTFGSSTNKVSKAVVVKSVYVHNDGGALGENVKIDLLAKCGSTNVATRLVSFDCGSKVFSITNVTFSIPSSYGLSVSTSNTATRVGMILE